MSTTNFKGNPTDPAAVKLREFANSMIKGSDNYIGESPAGAADPVEKFDLKDIYPVKGDLFSNFDKIQDIEGFYEFAEITELSTLNNFVLSVYQKIFADIVSVQLRTAPSNSSRLVFAVSFRFMTNEEFKQVKDDSETDIFQALIPTIDSSVSPQNSIAEQLLAINHNQRLSSSDMAKYAKWSPIAKGFLDGYIFTDQQNPKKKWINGYNYFLEPRPSQAYNGAKYMNIFGTVLLEAEKVALMITTTRETRKKFKASIEIGANKTNGMDQIIKLHLFNIARRKQLSNTSGIKFKEI